MGQISTTSQLLGSLGVNVHVEYTDGKYANASNVVADLSYLGITHVRDAVLNPSNQGQWSYDVLAAAGIKFDLFFQGNNLNNSLGLIDEFVARHPGAVSLIEGPNEVNNFPISYAGQTGNSAAVAYQGALYTAVHADSSLANVPVANLTSYPDLAGAADLANFHSYPKGGAEPFSTLSADGQRQAASETGRPLVMTEGGYSTLLNGRYADGVDELTQAKYTLNIFLDNAKAGVSSSYIYELLDAYADPTNSDPEKHYGLFHLDNTPKLAATAIHDLTTILSPGSDGSATASTLAFSTSGLPSTASTLTLTKAAGVHDLVLWNEPTIWNATTQREVTAASAPVTIHLGALADVTVYDPLNSAVAVQTLHNVQDVTLTLSDHPLVMEVKDLPPSTPVAPSSVTRSDGSIQTTTLNADGTTLKHVTGILGQPYVSSDSVYSASNVLLSVTRYNSAGTTVETDAYAADGSYVAHTIAPAGAAYDSSDQRYSVAGQLTLKTLYDATGGILETDAFGASGAHTTRTLYSSPGIVSESFIYNADGSYTAKVFNDPLYSSIEYSYNAFGAPTSKTTYGSNGQISAVYRYNTDGSYSAHLLNSGGYWSIDYSVDASGKLINQTACTASGQILSWTYTYRADGSILQHYADSSSTLSSVNYLFDPNGKVTAVYTNNADGSYSAHLLNDPAYDSIDYTVNSSGKLVNQTAHETNGHSVSWTYTYSGDGSLTQHYVDSASAYSAVDYVFDPTGKLGAVYAHYADGSYTAHLLNDPHYAAIDYTVGASGLLQSETYTDLIGRLTIQLFADGLSAATNVADEVFKLLGSSQQVNLGTNFGHVVIYDFTPGSDGLTISPALSSELSTALTHPTEDGHGNTQLVLDTHNSILLMGVSATSVLAHLADYHLAA